MAQPPDLAKNFVQEVDENLRRDRVRDFFKQNGSWLIAGLVVFLAVCAGIIWFQQHRQNQSEAEVEQIATIVRDIGTGNTSKVPQQLDQLTQSGSKGVRATAMFTQAALALQQSNEKLAIATYKKISEDNSLPDPYRDAATIRQTALEFDQLQPEQVIARLQPFVKDGEPWFGSAGEMTALALIKQGKTKEAGQLFARIAKDQNAPPGIRNRSLQISGSLGADSSAALGPQAQ